MKTHTTSSNQTNQTGFTIVELMVATLVFSVILVVISMGVISFTNSYRGGINSSTTQNVARNAIDAISQAIEFSGPSIFGATNPICAGGQQFDYSLGNVLPSGSGALYQRAAPLSCSPFGAFTGGHELLQPNMRLLKISVMKLVTPGNNLWSIDLRIAYAATNDLLCNSAVVPNTNPDGCDATNTISTAHIVSAGATIQCKAQAGSQFCAVSELSTTVQQRVQ